jgi:hypothetical protein
LEGDNGADASSQQALLPPIKSRPGYAEERLADKIDVPFSLFLDES